MFSDGDMLRCLSTASTTGSAWAAKTNIVAFSEIECDTLQRVWEEMDYRLDDCRVTKAGTKSTHQIPKNKFMGRVSLSICRWHVQSCPLFKCTDLMKCARELWLTLYRKLVKCSIWSISMYGTETWTLIKVDKIHLEGSEMWWCRRMKKIRWPDRVKNEEVLRTVKKDRNILLKIKRRKANWIRHVLRRNCFLEKCYWRKEKMDGETR